MAKDTVPTYREAGKAFERDMSYIPDRITAVEGRSQDPYGDQDLEVPTWPVQPGRYRLAAAKACPWANRAIIVRLRWHPPTIAYAQRRTAQGLTKKETIRCLKRFLAREIYHLLPQPSSPTNPPAAPGPKPQPPNPAPAPR